MLVQEVGGLSLNIDQRPQQTNFVTMRARQQCNIVTLSTGKKELMSVLIVGTFPLWTMDIYGVFQ